ncbi:hypothetical protein DFP72DRAFT_1059620 [Ephemerocybe angulata]|uniref:Uncharacterized protein n=1 Tax=Ephemerocybe angulata TaxID=980116 RepID=A0A8H6IGR5_9AGAR|nr:hypothetical protein DFP72DRAFT_1059620 [Tulosesus angulatus]
MSVDSEEDIDDSDACVIRFEQRWRRAIVFEAGCWLKDRRFLLYMSVMADYGKTRLESRLLSTHCRYMKLQLIALKRQRST